MDRLYSSPVSDAKLEGTPTPIGRESLVEQDFLIGARHWAGIALASFVLTSTAGALALVGVTLLLRALPSNEAGNFALVVALLEILALVGNLGFLGIVTRLYGAATPDTFDWLVDLAATAAYAAVPLALGVAAISAIYELPPDLLAFLLLGSILVVVLNTGCYMLSAHGHYIWASLLLRLPGALLVVPGSIAFFSERGMRLESVLIIYSIGILLTLGGLVVLLVRRLRRGSGRIHRPQRMEGIVFLASYATTYLPDQGVTAIAGALLPPERLAIYAAMAVFARPFKLAASILTMVMTPELVRRKQAQYRNLSLGVWGLALVGCVGTALIAPAIARWIYGGRYDEGLGILPLLACAGALQLTVVLPKSDLAGRAPIALLRRLVYLLAGVLGVATAASALLIVRFGVFGVGVAAVSLQSVRNLANYSVWRGYRRARAPCPPETTVSRAQDS